MCPRKSQRKLVHLIPNAHDCQEMLRTESNLSVSSDKQTREWAVEETKSSHFLSPHLAPASRFACGTFGAFGELARRLLRFSFL